MTSLNIQNVKEEIFLCPVIPLGKHTPLPQRILIEGNDPLDAALQVALSRNRALSQRGQPLWTAFWVCKIYTADIGGHILQSREPEILQSRSYFASEVKALSDVQRKDWGVTHGVYSDSKFCYPLRPGNRVYNPHTGKLIYTAPACK